ncbi:MAG: NAD(P)-dependent oxidoreductase [Desulfovibrio sp.]|nr:NAD(P)-dependent oxidoreductase [Desulfovibrio sp.]
MTSASVLSGRHVLLTGGTGFVGRHVLPVLLAAGARVTCLVRATSRTAHLPTAVNLVEADLRTGQGLAAAVEGKDIVIHMAALLFGLGWQDYLAANVLAAEHLARALAQKRARCLLMSSLAATGPCGQAPGVGDDAVPAPVSAYGWSKLLAEQTLAAALGERLVVLRPPIIYGSGDKGLLPMFRGVARGLAVSPGLGREFPVSAVHADDMARAVLCACRPQAHGVYHCNDGQVYTMSHLCRAMSRAVAQALGRPLRPLHCLHMPLPVLAFTAGLSSALGKLIHACGRQLTGRGLHRAPEWNLDKYREARQAGWLSDGSRMCAELGFEPQVGLDAGMLEAAQGYVREGWL